MSIISLRVNGCVHDVTSDPETPLIYVVRNELNLTGTKLGCELEQCGACAVLVDGKAVPSCNAPVGQFEGRDIHTIEATDDPTLIRVRQAFVDAGAAQCGYCIPGMVIAITALLKTNPSPDEAAIRAALQLHLCRCGTHSRVLDAARRLASGIASS